MTYLREILRPVERFALTLEKAPGGLDAAYAALAAYCQGRSGWAGWKLGGSNHATCAAFGVDRLYFGPLDGSELVAQPARAPGFALCELKGEVEISLRLDADATGYDAWCVALEMPASALTNLPEAGVAALVADRCGAGALLLGAPRQGALPEPGICTLRVNGTVLSEAGPEALTASPDLLLAQFLYLARQHGFTPRPGDWVATGGITACCAFQPGDRVEVLRDGAHELDFIADITGND